MIEAVYEYYPDGTVKRDRLLSGGKVIMDTEYHEDGTIEHVREWSNGYLMLDTKFDTGGSELVKVTYDCNGVINTLLDRRNPEEPTMYYFYENGALSSKTTIYPDGGEKDFISYLEDGTPLRMRNYDPNGRLTDAYDKYLEEE